MPKETIIKDKNDENNDKIITLLQFAQKAGKLVTGFDKVARSLFKGDIKLIILSKDLSLNSSQKIVSLNQTVSAPIVVWGKKKDTLQFSVKETGILAVTDINFKNGLLKHI